MKCPKCKSKSEVLETIQQDGQTKRRRKCLSPKCMFRFASYETIEGAASGTRSQESPLPEWIDKIRSRPGVDKEAIAAAYRVDQRRKEIEREQKARARQEAGWDYDEEVLTPDDIRRELRGY